MLFRKTYNNAWNTILNEIKSIPIIYNIYICTYDGTCFSVPISIPNFDFSGIDILGRFNAWKITPIRKVCCKVVANLLN
jgi:hypothetical protein